jgi:hypothetical protein
VRVVLHAHPAAYALAGRAPPPVELVLPTVRVHVRTFKPIDLTAVRVEPPALQDKSVQQVVVRSRVQWVRLSVVTYVAT